jgi:protein disulfide-isomerase A6
MFTLKAFSLLAVFASSVIASNVIELTPKNFDEIINSGKPALVNNLHLLLIHISNPSSGRILCSLVSTQTAFCPYCRCGHCKSLAPVYEELADSFKYAQDKVIIAKLDADAHPKIGQRFGVKGFPTLKVSSLNNSAYTSGSKGKLRIQKSINPPGISRLSLASFKRRLDYGQRERKRNSQK